MEYYNCGFPKFYDLVQYGIEERIATEQEMSFCDNIFKNVAGRKIEHILDVGCGTGRFLIPLKQNGFDVAGLDLSSEMIEECKKRLAKRNCSAEFYCMSIEEIDFKEKYDAIVCIDSVICYITEPERMVNALKLLYNSLKPGGVLIMETWNIFNELDIVPCERRFQRESENRKADVYEYDKFCMETKMLNNHIEITGYEDGKIYNICFKDNMRMVAYDEMCGYMIEAAFKQVECYSGFDFSEPSQECGDSFVYVGVKE